MKRRMLARAATWCAWRLPPRIGASLCCCIVATATVFLTATGQAAPIVVNFDTLPGGGNLADNTQLTDQYIADGVTFSGSSADVPIATGDFCGTGNPNNCGTSGQILANVNPSQRNPAQTIVITFTAPVDDISFLFIPFGDTGNGVTVLAFADTHKQPLFTGITGDQNSGGCSMSCSYLFAVGGSGATSLELTAPVNPGSGTGAFWVWGLDDLTFTPSAAGTAAEPTSLALLGLTLAGLGFAARRRRAG